MKVVETKAVLKSAQRTCINGHRVGDLENIERGASEITNSKESHKKQEVYDMGRAPGRMIHNKGFSKFRRGKELHLFCCCWMYLAQRSVSKVNHCLIFFDSKGQKKKKVCGGSNIYKSSQYEDNYKKVKLVLPR